MRVWIPALYREDQRGVFVGTVSWAVPFHEPGLKRFNKDLERAGLRIFLFCGLVEPAAWEEGRPYCGRIYEWATYKLSARGEALASLLVEEMDGKREVPTTWHKLVPGRRPKGEEGRRVIEVSTEGPPAWEDD